METSARASRVTVVADELRVALGATHQEFVAAMQRDKTEWAHMRAGRRGASPAFMRALRACAAHAGGIWPSRVDVAIQQDALAAVA
ncbi:MAG TPA: hypothetical protein VNM48_09100 [Chloroflexota bacterium]|nr:hypothetical protein [Chloroflexota bacterium]